MDRFLIEQRTGTRPRPTTVYLIRHGESTHNAHSYYAEGADINDARYIDAVLTARGEAQARSIASRVKELNLQVVVSSPLTRAVQTCLLACSESSLPPPVITPLCTERLAYACDIGSPVSVLEDRFPNIDFGLVAPREGWWWAPDDDDRSAEATLARLRKHGGGSYHKDCEPQKAMMDRINAFRVWLLERSETRIGVFAHGVFLRAFAGTTDYFGNTEIRKIVL